jgi:hypothetical protein
MVDAISKSICACEIMNGRAAFPTRNGQKQNALGRDEFRCPGRVAPVRKCAGAVRATAREPCR